MRLWSVHPRYLDVSGLTACWREGLLARKVLRGETKGYRNHPQLLRFKSSSSPLKMIDLYLWYIYEEARKRGYHFDKSKIEPELPGGPYLSVTNGQVQYEFQHLLAKLRMRSPDLYARYMDEARIIPHPLFRVEEGEIADWEVVKE